MSKNKIIPVKGKQITYITKSNPIAIQSKLLASVASIIENSRHKVAIAVNSELVLLYWNIGNVMRKDILQNKRAGYGEQTIQTLSEQLTGRFGSGWSTRQLWNCVRTADTFSKNAIMHALRSQLSWTHIRLLIGMDDPFILKCAEWNTGVHANCKNVLTLCFMSAPPSQKNLPNLLSMN